MSVEASEPAPATSRADDANALARRWAELRADQPKLRIRDAATTLGVSEGALVASRTGDTVVRLRPDWPALLGGLGALGTVMALTRNENAVHEKTGVYPKPEVFGAMGQFVSEAIDLRLFLSRWRSVYALDESKEGGRKSLTVFDVNGTAAHKVFLTDASDAGAYGALVAALTADDQAPGERFEPVIAPPPDKPDAEVDTAGFVAAWDAMRDTHELHGLMRRFGISRVQALRLAGLERARRVATSSLRAALESAAATGQRIMVFVGSPGVIQIHTGPVKRIVPTGPWINVLDDDFNLHARQDGIATAWVVKKPTIDGIVTSLELYDATGTTIALLFGARKPGKPEDPAWRAIVDGLATLAPEPA